MVRKPLRDTFRVRSSGNRSVEAVAPAINGNADALRELQEIAVEILDRLAALESAERAKP